MTLAEAAQYCRFDDCAHPVKAFRQWAHRHAVPFARRGRTLLVEQSALDAVLFPDRVRHGHSVPTLVREHQHKKVG